jgi:hypothetical protein
VLGGIESVPVEQAFPFAFDRTGASVLIDVSKSIEWASRQIEANPSFNFKLIHLIRDPRGWYASEHRRSPLSMDALLDRWVSENRDIEQFLKRSRIPSYSVFYDQLAANPESEFYPLCDFLGLRFHPQALQYWKLAHHGFSANGASSFLLKGKAKKADKTGLLADIMITGDDRYYEAHQCSSFFDERWKTTLTAEEIEAITNRADVQAVLANYEHSLSADGVEELELAVR